MHGIFSIQICMEICMECLCKGGTQEEGQAFQRATKYTSLLRKETCKDKASYESCRSIHISNFDRSDSKSEKCMECCFL